MDKINQPPQGQIFNTPGRPELPNATAILVLGIISIVGCFCYGIPGLICGIIALVMASKSKKMADLNPDFYSEGSVKNMKAGRVCAIVGTCLSSIYFLVVLFYLIFVGTMLSTIPWQQFKH